MQRSSGHSSQSVITPASTSRANSAQPSDIARHRTLAMPYRQPSPADRNAYQATTSVNGSNLVDAENGRLFLEPLRDEAILSVMQLMGSQKKQRVGAKQARALSKAVSHG